MMQPKLNLLTPDLAGRVLAEAFQLLRETGVQVQLPEARQLLAEAGARIDEARQVVCLPESLVQNALATTPEDFYLYNRAGEPVVHYGGDDVHFDPGSCGVHALDPATGEHRPSTQEDLIRIVKVAERLPQFAAQSTALVCHDVPTQLGDIYRLYIVLLHSQKPVITGAFTPHGGQAMFELLRLEAGGDEALRRKPRAIFDVCPTPPMIWSEFGSQNLIDLARAGVPAQIVSMPLAGAGSPVTLIGSIVQHAAECLSGITLHQIASPGAPIVWGGAPAIFDMHKGTTPMGAIETAMIDAGYAQVGKSLGLPTHAYLGASDAKIVDAQAGLESGVTAVVGALAGINMISGAGMLDFLACASAEKLVFDAEAIGMAQRLLKGIGTPTPTLALELMAGMDFKADFLYQQATLELFKGEQYLPSEVIDRGSARRWEDKGRLDAFQRACQRTETLLAGYQRPALDPALEREMEALVKI